jgi:iron complex outermembrane receptor protein
MTIRALITSLSISASIVGIAAPAFADDAGREAAAKGAEEQDSGEMIVVTARRFDEKLLDVPIAITAYTQEQLESRNVSTANDIAAFTPSLTANARFGVENTTFSIRGFIQDPFTAPSVGMYFAEAPSLRGASSVQSGEGAGPGSFFDLQNVQVLKGPQGTLFGRNTTGGTILLVPKKPTSEFGGYAEGSYGNYNLARFQTVLNVPVGNGGLRLGFERMSRDGYTQNIGIGPSKLANINYVAARISFLQRLTPDFENYTIITYAKSDTNGNTPKPVQCDATVRVGSNNPALGVSLTPTATGQIPSGQMSCDSLARINATGNFWTVENPMANVRSYLKQFQFINTTTWSVSDEITLKNIVSYGEIKNLAAQDPLGTFWKIRADDPNAGVNGRFGNFTGSVVLSSQSSPAAGLYTNNQSTLTEELQLHGLVLDGKLDWQVGGYYEYSETLDPYVGTRGTNTTLCTDIANLVCKSPYGFTGSVTEGLRNTTYRDFGIFAQAIYKITDSLRLTTGIRYTQNGSKAVDEQRTYRFRTDGGISTTCSNANGVLPGCVIVTPTDGGFYKTSAPTWLASLDYKPSQNSMIYGKYARGYRQGTVDPRSLAPYKTFGAEKLDTYEVGGKVDWRGAMPGALNVAAFYNSFPKQQFLLTWADSAGLRTTTGIANSARSRSYGLEVDGGIEPIRGIRLTGGFTYLDSKLLEVASPSAGPPGFPAVVEAEQVGRPFPFAAKFKNYLRTSIDLPIKDSLGKLSVSGTWQHTSGYFSSGRLLSWVNGNSTFALNADWKNVGGQPLDIGFFANNVTQTKYYTYTTDTLVRVGVITAFLGEPRTFGLRVKARFGADAN